MEVGHKHNFVVQEAVKVPLSKYEYIDGKLYGQISGYDLLRVKKCLCGMTETYGLIRNPL